MKPLPPKPKGTNARLAGIYGTSERQIARWKKGGAPLLDVAGMLTFFATRHSAPPHLVAVSDEQQAALQAKLDALEGGSPKGKLPAKARKAVDPEFVKSLPQGAEHALRRLQGEEPRLFALMLATEDDPLLQAAIRKQWRETLLSLKQFEVLVEADKRGSGETITRAEIQGVLYATVVWIRRGIESFLNSICLEIAEADSPQKVYAAIAPSIRQSIGSAVDAATSDGKIPGWLRETMTSAL